MPSARVAARYGYAFVEGAGGAPAVFGAGLHNVFDVSVPVKTQPGHVLPVDRRDARGPAPKTAAYATIDDPFTQPQIPEAQQILQKAGVKTGIVKVFPAEVADFTPIATQIASTQAEPMVLGSVDVPTVSSFVHTFIQQHYKPKAFIATAGPDQGEAFVKAVGRERRGHLRPQRLVRGIQKADSQQMVKEYIAKYGGTASDVNADVAEAYSVGQVVAQPVEATHSLDN